MDLDALLPRLVAARSLEDADDIASVLHARVARGVEEGGRELGVVLAAQLDRDAADPCGGQVVETATIIDLPELGGSTKIRDAGYSVFAVCSFNEDE